MDFKAARKKIEQQQQQQPICGGDPDTIREAGLLMKRPCRPGQTDSSDKHKMHARMMQLIATSTLAVQDKK